MNPTSPGPPEHPRTGAPRLEVEVGAVLFDMDGTLVDSIAVDEAIWAGFAHRYALDPGEVLEHTHGRQTLDSVRHFLPAERDPRAVAAELQAEALTRTDGITEIPGAVALLEQLAGTPVAVVTSAPRAMARRRLRAAGLPAPALLVAAEDVTEGKPSPEGYRRAAALLGTAPRRCLVFEDAEAGIRAAVASTARTVVIGTHVSDITTGLPRIPDYTALTVSAGTSGPGARRFHHP